MSASFFDLMKYARTGIASPEMTGFDKVRARAAFGGYPVSTITGTPPISFKADGKPLSAWSIAGNMVQTGTPAPDAPITPEECGDLVTTGDHAGEYAIPVTITGTTTPIYLSEPLRRIGDYADTVSSDGVVTRRINKLVLTGTERWNMFSTAVVQQFYTQGQNIGGLALSSAFSTVAPYGMTTNDRTGNFGCYTATSGTEIAFQMHGARDVFNSQSAWTEYLAAQYAAGTPVTVWYVLATPITSTITVPTLTTAKGSNTLTVDTTLQPSQVSITGNIKQA